MSKNKKDCSRGGGHLSTIYNHEGGSINTTKLTVAYSRTFNLGNLLTYRLLDVGDGPPASSYVIRGQAGHRERDREREIERERDRERERKIIA